MKFRLASTMGTMTPWQIIEEALARRKPPRRVQWLADQLDASAQVVNNWKSRGVPAARRRDVARVLGLTMDQLEGEEPPPWEKDQTWPFPDIDRARFYRLSPLQQGEIQGRVRDMIAQFEKDRGSGKSSGSQSNAGPRRAA